MKTDILVNDLIKYLPHRSPMIWIDRIIEVGDDYKGLKGLCAIDVKKEALYFYNEKKIKASSAIEFTAQSFGYLKAAFQEIHNINNPPSKTLLTGVRSCRSLFSNIDFVEGDVINVKIRVLKEILPVIYVRGEMTLNKSNEIIAVAEIQVYVE